MTWPNPFRVHDEDTRCCYGYTFQWTPLHQDADEIEGLKFTYDVRGEKALDRLDEIWPPESSGFIPRNQPERRRFAREKKEEEKEEEEERGDDGGGGGAGSGGKVDDESGGSEEGGDENNKKKKKKKKRDLYELLKENAHEGGVLGELWDEVNTIPEWVDWEQIQRGQDVFYRYGGAALTALAYQSLLGGMGASRVTEVLTRTGGFNTKVAKQRMFETVQHILQCTMSLDNIKPGGAGFASTIRVRLLHAAVRRRILKLAEKRPEYYCVEEHGIPINDLDSIGTISTFSATLIWMGLPRQLIWIRPQEITDYIALWRLIAHYIGVDPSYFSTPERARAIMESIMINEIHPSATSRALANNIITSLQGQSPTYASRQFLEANARWLNGHELSDALGLGHPGFYYWLLVSGQVAFFVVGAWIKRLSPALDRRSLRSARKFMYDAIILSDRHGLGHETDFAFKYIPTYGLVTPHASHVVDEVNVKGVERRSLVVLVMVGVVVGGVAWIWGVAALGAARWAWG